MGRAGLRGRQAAEWERMLTDMSPTFSPAPSYGRWTTAAPSLEELDAAPRLRLSHFTRDLKILRESGMEWMEKVRMV